MEEQLISFETAKLAKEKGFQEECLHFYCLNRTCNHVDKANKYSFEVNANKESDDNFGYGKTTSAPTQSLLQKWLREEHMEHVTSNIGELGYSWKIAWRKEGGFYKTYEEALERGLVEALKLIQKK